MSDCKHNWKNENGYTSCKWCEFDPSEDYLKLEKQLQASQAEVERLKEVNKQEILELQEKNRDLKNDLDEAGSRLYKVLHHESKLIALRESNFSLNKKLKESQADAERLKGCIEWGEYECKKLFKYGDACNVDQAEGMRKLLAKLNETQK